MSTKDAPIRFMRGQIYANMNDKDKAINDIEQALEMGLPEELEGTARQMLAELV
jgi:hypothetical protein